jgi:hypothetical protein
MIKLKINANKFQVIESYGQDKNLKIRISLSPIEKNKIFPLLTGKDITPIN